MSKQEYYVGLDIGTGSVGWAATDNEYQLQKVHGKTLWGSRLFETAKTAEERRIFRTNRRRLARRNSRIRLLQELFAEEIAKVDMGFYHRLKESRYMPEDKKDLTGGTPELPYALFVDENFTDKEYHEKYPTIYHLRHALMHSEDSFDVRLVYLAIHHILKHRGHFLFMGKKMGEIRKLEPAYENMVRVLGEYLNVDEEESCFSMENEKIEKLAEIITDVKKGKTQKKTELQKCFACKNKKERAILALLAGSMVKLSDIFEDNSLDESEKAKISFSDNNYDEYENKIEDVLGEKYVVIRSVKAVYDWALLNEIMQGYNSLSEAKVASYEKHHVELIILKQLLKEKAPEKYKIVFGYPENGEANYSAYVGMVKINGKKKPLPGKRCTREDFYGFLRKILEKIDDARAEKILEQIEQEDFLVRQLVKDNGVILLCGFVTV